MQRGAKEDIAVGVSISSTGKYATQGRDAFNGIRLWVKETNRQGGIYLGKSRPLRLIHYDDHSESGRAVANVDRLLRQDQVDILLGPYSSGLTMAVTPIAEEHGKVLWNHGGSADALFERGWRWLVSVPSPASHYLRGLPALLRNSYGQLNRIAVLQAQKSSFAAAVVSGLESTARAERFELFRISFVSRYDGGAGAVQEALLTHPEVITSVGTFQDDIQVVRNRNLFSPPVKSLAAVAAGVNSFYRDVGELAEGVIGPTQWEARIADSSLEGPDSQRFIAKFVGEFGEVPDYTAAQSYAAGIVVLKCIEGAGSLADEELRRVAGELDFRTFYGRFRIDPLTGRQIGHQVLLTQWLGGERRIIWPPEAAQEAPA
jgi:branched-chain amino acid transport system substrate-binding protein